MQRCWLGQPLRRGATPHVGSGYAEPPRPAASQSRPAARWPERLPAVVRRQASPRWGRPRPCVLQHRCDRLSGRWPQREDHRLACEADTRSRPDYVFIYLRAAPAFCFLLAKSSSPLLCTFYSQRVRVSTGTPDEDRRIVLDS